MASVNTAPKQSNQKPAAAVSGASTDAKSSAVAVPLSPAEQAAAVAPNDTTGAAADTGKKKSARVAPDLSKMTPEARAEFEALTKQIEDEKKVAAERRRKLAELTGIPLPTRSVASEMGDLNGDLVVAANLKGFRETGSKDVAVKIGDGMPMSEVLKLDGVNNEWVRYNFSRGALTINGKNFVEALNSLPKAPAKAAGGETKAA